MQKPIKKATLVLWIIGGIMLIGSLISIGSNAEGAAVGIVAALVLGLIGFLVGRKKTEGTAAAREENEAGADPYEVRKYRVAGVTFTTGKNDDVNRQDILRHICYKEAPYDKYTIVLKKYNYKGEAAIGLYVNGNDYEQIGNIPAEDVKEVLPLMNRIERTALEVYGGGAGRNFGASVFLFLKNDR